MAMKMTNYVATSPPRKGLFYFIIFHLDNEIIDRPGMREHLQFATHQWYILHSINISYHNDHNKCMYVFT